MYVADLMLASLEQFSQSEQRKRLKEIHQILGASRKASTRLAK
jgi:hypothetical protein